MGDPKFNRRKYDTPSHPWRIDRITSENEVVRKYGLKNKTEIWKVQSLLRTYRQRARNLQAKIRYGDRQAEKEKDEFIQRLDSLGIVSKEASLDDILSLNLESLLSRRLQTMAYLKGYSNSAKQARQFIVHGHIAVNGKKMTIPGYMVKRSEEELVTYLAHSPLADELHPARPKDESSLETPETASSVEVSTEASGGVDPSKTASAAEPAPATEAKPEKATEPAPKPAAEPAPATESKPEKTAEPAPKPVAEPAPATEPKPEKTAEPAPEPAAEPAPAPEAKPTAEPKELAKKPEKKKEA